MKTLHARRASIILSSSFLSEALAKYALSDQIGRLPDQPKFVCIIESDDSFSVIGKSNGEVMLAGPVVMTASRNPSTLIRTFRGSFSSFSQPGTYQISTPTGDISYQGYGLFWHNYSLTTFNPDVDSLTLLGIDENVVGLDYVPKTTGIYT